MTLLALCSCAGTNNTLKPARSEDPLGFLHWVSKWQGNKMAVRIRAAQCFRMKHPLTPYAKSLYDEQRAICATTKYEFDEIGDGMYQVTNTKSKRTHTVTLKENQWKCSPCTTWIEFGVLCRHMLWAMSNLKIKPLTPANVMLYWPRWARSASYHDAYLAAGGVRHV